MVRAETDKRMMRMEARAAENEAQEARRYGRAASTPSRERIARGASALPSSRGLETSLSSHSLRATLQREQADGSGGSDAGVGGSGVGRAAAAGGSPRSVSARRSARASPPPPASRAPPTAPIYRAPSHRLSDISERLTAEEHTGRTDGTATWRAAGGEAVAGPRYGGDSRRGPGIGGEGASVASFGTDVVLVDTGKSDFDVMAAHPPTLHQQQQQQRSHQLLQQHGSSRPAAPAASHASPRGRQHELASSGLALGASSVTHGYATGSQQQPPNQAVAARGGPADDAGNRSLTLEELADAEGAAGEREPLGEDLDWDAHRSQVSTSHWAASASAIAPPPRTAPRDTSHSQIDSGLRHAPGPGDVAAMVRHLRSGLDVAKRQLAAAGSVPPPAARGRSH